MSNRMRVLAMAAVIGVLAAISAQAGVAVKANVPFDFVVADRHLPAGEYWFENQAPGVLRIYSDDMKRTVLTHYRPAWQKASGPGKLIFQRHGSQHYLQSVDSAAAGIAAALPQSRAEKEWSQPSIAAMISVALK